MFENLLGQPAAERLKADLLDGMMAPSMLFYGPPASGKGTAALELARALSCQEGPENRAAWNCGCGSCIRHRILAHRDLLLLGPRAFSPEIAAAASAFLRESENQPALFLFLRAVRKLTGRFSPVIMEDDPKAGKLSGLLLSIEEELDELSREKMEAREREKLCASIVKDALRLENEGIADPIPIAHIRRAAGWSHTAAGGNRKFILIENADRMREEARNSLLKLLEEPPADLSVVLTTSFKGAILATIQSRLRPYRFIKRESAVEAGVLRRVFRVPGSPPGDIAAYLDSFLPVTDGKLRPLAAFFILSLARSAALSLRKRGPLPEELLALGRCAAPLAEAAGLAPPEDGGLIPLIVNAADNFEARSFPRFLSLLLDLYRELSRSAAASSGNDQSRWIAYNDIWKSAAADAAEAVGVWNQSPVLALERLFTEIKEAIAGLV
jgi:DNA polymerase-3 subunit gamma/tau